MSSFKIYVRSGDLTGQPSGDLLFRLNRAKRLEGKWEVALVGGQMVNSVPNISAALGNNTLRYSTDGGSSYTTITLPNGTYQTSAIEEEVQKVLYANGDYTINPDTGLPVYKIDFAASIHLLRITVSLAADTRLDLTTGGLHDVLGFNAVELDGGASGATFTAPNIAKFTDRSLNYFITSDLILEGVYVNEQIHQGVLKTVNGGTPGYGISFKEPSGVYDYFPVSKDTLSEIRITVLDNLGSVADLRGEETAFELHFRRVDGDGGGLDPNLSRIFRTIDLISRRHLKSEGLI